MISGFDVAQKIRAYLSGQSDLDSFREWMVSVRIELAGEKDKAKIDQDAIRLLAELEARYAEFSDEVLSLDAWKARLNHLLAPKPQSVQSYFLTSFYASPLQPPVASASSWSSTGNFNQASNYQPPVLIDDAVAA